MHRTLSRKALLAAKELPRSIELGQKEKAGQF